MHIANVARNARRLANVAGTSARFRNVTITTALVAVCACADAWAEHMTDGSAARVSGAGDVAAAGTAPATTPDVATGGDSILPMNVMITRFQAELPALTAFGADAPASRDELIARLTAAVADSSADALQSLVLDRAEYAYLYFPTSIYARAPYAQPPAVNWLLLEQNSLKGRARLLRTYGGRMPDVTGYRCEADPRVEGGNLIWEQCVITLRVGGDVRLFGSIIERTGRFRLMSLANRL